VRVTGYRKRVRMDLPVLDEKAEERYQRQHSEMNPNVDDEGRRAAQEGGAPSGPAWFAAAAAVAEDDDGSLGKRVARAERSLAPTPLPLVANGSRLRADARLFPAPPSACLADTSTSPSIEY
jgi:hypothetical protein